MSAELARLLARVDEAESSGEPAVLAAVLEAAVCAAADGEGAEPQLSAAAAARPARAWPLLLLAAARASRRDLAGADLALGEALVREDRAWLHAERARVRESLGVLPDAIASARRAAALEPTAENWALLGDLLQRWREHVEAAEVFALAAAAAPADPSLHFRRAESLSAAGRFGDARAAARAAERLSGGDAALTRFRRWLDLLSGDAKDAVKDPFLKAYADMRAKRWAKARAGFAAYARKATPVEARRASFYAATCAALEAAPPYRGAERMTLAGLGVDPPYTATAEAVRAVVASDVVFNNVMGTEMFVFLRALCKDVRPVAYHQDNDEAALSDEMCAELAPGKRVMFATRGSAIVYGPLGTELARRCAAKKVPWRSLVSVSSADSIDARLGGVERGSAVADSSALDAAAMTDQGVPLTAYVSFDKGDDSYSRFSAAAAKARGATAPMDVYDHVIGQEPLSWTTADLAAKRDRLSVSAIVHFPTGVKR